MKKFIMALLLLPLLTGCATTYAGFNAIRIKAEEFTANCGPLNSFSGKNVDGLLLRESTLTFDENRGIMKHPDMSMQSNGTDSSLNITK